METKIREIRISRPYQEELLKALTDPVEAAEYLNAALDEGSSDLFVLALQNVAKAQALRKFTKNMREAIEMANHSIPDIEHIDVSDLSIILDSIGLRFAAEVK